MYTEMYEIYIVCRDVFDIQCRDVFDIQCIQRCMRYTFILALCRDVGDVQGM